MTIATLYVAVVAAKLLQSCPTLRDPIDGSLPGSLVPGVLQARTIEWVAISFSSAWKWKVKEKSLSRVRLLATPWTAAYQAAPSMWFSRIRILEWVAIGFSMLYIRLSEFVHLIAECFYALTLSSYFPHCLNNPLSNITVIFFNLWRTFIK